MIEQISNAIKFIGFYVASKQGKTGLTVTCDVYKNGTLIVTAGACTEIGGGLYSYTLASGSVDAEGDYLAIFKTADATVDAQWLPALWLIQKAGVENLDAATSTRLASASYTAPDNAGISTLLGRVIGTLAAGTHQPQSGDAYTVAGLVKVVTDKLATMLQVIGLNWQFTTEALWLAPTGTASISDADKSDIAGRAWSSLYAPVRELTQESQTIIDELATPGTISVYRGDAISFTILLGDITGQTNVCLSVKTDLGLPDTAAIIKVDAVNGLLVLNRSASVTAADCAITVQDESTGSTDFEFDASVAAQLPVGDRYYYDIQVWDANDAPTTKDTGIFIVRGDVTRDVDYPTPSP